MCIPPKTNTTQMAFAVRSVVGHYSMFLHLFLCNRALKLRSTQGDSEKQLVSDALIKMRPTPEGYARAIIDCTLV